LFLVKKPHKQTRQLLWGTLCNRGRVLSSTPKSLRLRCQAQQSPRVVVSGGSAASTVQEQSGLVVEKSPVQIIHFYRVPFIQESAAAELLKEAQAKISNQIVDLKTEQCFNVGLGSQLSSGKLSVLKWLLSETFEPKNLGTESFLEKKCNDLVFCKMSFITMSLITTIKELIDDNT